MNITSQLQHKKTGKLSWRVLRQGPTDKPLSVGSTINVNGLCVVEAIRTEGAAA